MGAAESSVVTNLPLQVRPILPRVLRAGDRFSLAAMAANNGSTRLEATVSLSLAGSSLVANGPVERRVTLEPGASERVLFDVEAKAVGEGTITLAIASGGVVADSAELPLAITSPVVLETTALSGIVGGSGDGVVDETLADLAGLRTDVGSLTVSLSASPLAGLGAGLEQLVQYPYGCTEQTTSRLVPLLHLQPLARALNVKLPDDLPKVSADAVRRILANQREDGGFGLWAGSKQSEPWLSAYATWGLGEAAKLGVPVDAVALGRARGYLLALLAGWGETTEARVAAPFALDVLVSALDQGKEQRTDEPAGSGLDHVSLGEIGAQIASRQAELPVFAQAHLLHALALLGREEEARGALIRELVSAVHLDGPLARFVSIDRSHARHFDSSARSGALVLRALLAAEPTHPLVTPLALGLVADRRGGTWRTTQETAWALLALNDYRAHTPESVNGGPRAEVELAGKSVLAHTFLAAPGAIAPDAEITLPMATVLASLDHAGPGSARTLSFAARGGSPIAYQARLRSAPRDRPRDEVTAGFSLQRRYLVVPTTPQRGAAEPSELSFDAGDTYTEGATVLVELTVTTSSERRWVAIDDPLPGGFETLDLALEGGQGYLRPLLSRGATREEHRDDRTVFFVDELPPGVTRYTHLVRATQRGRFVAPAAKVEEMYTPETFGRTAARVIQVEAVKLLSYVQRLGRSPSSPVGSTHVARAPPLARGHGFAVRRGLRRTADDARAARQPTRADEHGRCVGGSRSAFDERRRPGFVEGRPGPDLGRDLVRAAPEERGWPRHLQEPAGRLLRRGDRAADPPAAAWRAEHPSGQGGVSRRDERRGLHPLLRWGDHPRGGHLFLRASGQPSTQALPDRLSSSLTKGSVRRAVRGLLVLGGLVVAAGCARRAARCAVEPSANGRACALVGYPDRAFDLVVPPGEGGTPRPLLILFHGGGGSRRSAETVTCPDGDPREPGCLGNVAIARGFVVARPDGTGARLLPNVRTWNAGGGKDGLQCVSGRACADGVDDIAYVRALLDEIARLTPVDQRRVYVAGLSNGGAFAHRVACELGGRVAGVVAVGGANQFQAAGGVCPRPVPVLQIHGTADPCWAFTGGNGACLQDDGQKKQGAVASTDAWATINGCSGRRTETPPDRDASDGTTRVRVIGEGCRAATELWRMEGGGHTWPSGHPYFPERRIGRVSREATNDDLLDWLSTNTFR
jgi:poly(3-hydroxybutyrate) depolymerase